MKLADIELGLGGAPLGNLFTPVADADAVALVRNAWDCGIRYFDTAPHYGNGLSERRLGGILRGMPRDAFLLSTKVGRRLVADAAAAPDQHGYVDVLPYAQQWDYSFDGTRASIEESLARLGIVRVDYVFIHDVARDAHGDRQPQRFREAMEGAVPALAQLKADGVIAGYGLGVNDWRVCVDAFAHADPDVLLLAGRYTLLDQSALPVLMPLCERRGTRIVIGGPFNSGILATGSRPADGSAPRFDYVPAPPGIIAKVARIEAVCARHGVALESAALQFPRAHPAVATVVAGARSPAELSHAIAMMRAPIPPAFWQELRARGLLAPDAPLPQ